MFINRFASYKLIKTLDKCLCLNIVHKQVVRTLSYVAQHYEHTHDPAPVFFNNEIQSILKTLTRIDLGKVYEKKKLGGKALEQPIYKFMTDEQLEEALNEAKQKVDELLQMPPVVPIRQPIDKVLDVDPHLIGLETSNYVFTDVTFGIKDSDRLITIREPDGTLREAPWEVRDRINQIYFPKDCQKVEVPKMFNDDYFENLLVRNEFVFVLDRACVQFEPNNPEYQKITSITYQYVNEHNEFDKLRSTRHFGPMAFYLSWFKNIDNLLLELIETAHIEEANNLLKLYQFMHKLPLNVENVHDLGAITNYISEYSQKKAPLELAIQAYKDLEQQRKQLQEGIKIAHGL